MIRSGAEFNFYKILNLQESWDSYVGAGIRNINQYKYGYFLQEGAMKNIFILTVRSLCSERTIDFRKKFL